MEDKQARELAIANHLQRVENYTNASLNDGGHGIMWPGTERDLLNYLLTDYSNAIADKPVAKVEKSEPEIRGRYVTQSRW